MCTILGFRHLLQCYLKHIKLRVLLNLGVQFKIKIGFGKNALQKSKLIFFHLYYHYLALSVFLFITQNVEKLSYAFLMIIMNSLIL